MCHKGVAECLQEYGQLCTLEFHQRMGLECAKRINGIHTFARGLSHCPSFNGAHGH